eukprot:m.39866 g.39866  ORF g.39866 m.39866 type:complete len:167 (+) comp11661_c0_seq4:651-1151(+)
MCLAGGVSTAGPMGAVNIADTGLELFSSRVSTMSSCSVETSSVSCSIVISKNACHIYIYIQTNKNTRRHIHSAEMSTHDDVTNNHVGLLGYTHMEIQLYNGVYPKDGSDVLLRERSTLFQIKAFESEFDSGVKGPMIQHCHCGKHVAKVDNTVFVIVEKLVNHRHA